jgi:serine/threonine protein kinase
MLHALNAKLNQLLIQTKLNFKTIEIAGSGSDGVVFTNDETRDSEGNLVAIKLFSVHQHKPRLREAHESISHDQAMREYKALDLIRNNPHPNFLKLISREVDEIENLIIGGVPRSGFAVQMELMKEAMPICTTSRIWGKRIDETDRTCIDLTLRNNNLRDITHQLCSAVRHLSGIGLKHRHLEEGNIHVRLPDFRAIIIDFARSDSPAHFGMNSPQNVLHDAMNGRGVGFHGASDDDKEDLEELYGELYASALSTAPAYQDVSDYLAIRAVIRELWFTHRYQDLEQYNDSDTYPVIAASNDAMESELLESLLPEDEQKPFPQPIQDEVEHTRKARHKVIQHIIAKRGFHNSCKREGYAYVVQPTPSP